MEFVPIVPKVMDDCVVGSPEIPSPVNATVVVVAPPPLMLMLPLNAVNAFGLNLTYTVVAAKLPPL